MLPTLFIYSTICKTKPNINYLWMYKKGEILTVNYQTITERVCTISITTMVTLLIGNIYMSATTSNFAHHLLNHYNQQWFSLKNIAFFVGNLTYIIAEIILYLNHNFFAWGMYIYKQIYFGNDKICKFTTTSNLTLTNDQPRFKRF